jgi:hypothetical protein
MKPSKETEFAECLAGYIMGDLTTEEFKEYESVKPSTGTPALSDLERVAATVSLSALDQLEAMPESLRRAVSNTGRAIVSEVATRRIADVVEVAPPQSGRVRERLAWIACLAASLLAVFFWQRSPGDSDRDSGSPLTRDSLIASATDLIQTKWSEGTTPLKNDVTGDIVWSDSQQRGFMRFVGMPANDPKVWQYQLWILDPSRDSDPIDGGVFDITTGEESIVAIQAKLPVNQPIGFAVTIEKPGGVVVSDQKRMPLLAFVQPEKKKKPAGPEI